MRYFCQIFTKFEFPRQIFEKVVNIKFHQNLSIGSRVLPCGQTNEQTDVTKLTVAFRNFANAPKNSYLLPAADAGVRPFCSQANKITSFKYFSIKWTENCSTFYHRLYFSWFPTHITGCIHWNPHWRQIRNGILNSAYSNELCRGVCFLNK